MLAAEIEEFARILAKEVRDRAIQNCDRQRRTDAHSPLAERWRAVADTGDVTTAADILIPDCVDETLFCLLQAIDQGVLRLEFNASTGRAIDLVNEGAGELSGWYMSTDGWRGKYSMERFVDDFADL